MKPIVVVCGNCQANFVVNFLKALPEIGQQYEIRRFRDNDPVELEHGSADGNEAEDLPTFLQANRQHVVAFLLQSTHNWRGQPITRADLAPGTIFVEFPVALNCYLWPLICHDESFDNMSVAIRRRYPPSIHDTLLRKLKANGVPEAEVVDAYMAHDITGMFRLDRLRKMQDFKVRQIDAKATFPIGDYIDANLSNFQIFRSNLHPSGPFMAELTRRILECLPIVTDCETAAYRLDLAARGPGIHPFDAPIHPQIVRHFGLRWAEIDRYQFWDEGYYSFTESLLRFYQMRACFKFGEATKLLRQGLLQPAQQIMETAVAEVPRSAAYRLLLAEIYFRQKAFAAGLMRTRQAWEIEPTLVTGVHLARALLRNRERDKAAEFVDELSTKFGEDSVDLQMMKSNLLAATGNKAGALELLRKASNSPLGVDYRIWQSMASMLDDQKQLAMACEAMEKAYALSGMASAIGKKLTDLRSRLSGQQLQGA
ncbi:WcbI family polysaccharide biosynthesis putative acetyltransferase [Reyranella sp.]|uniref:WcbI family polysaccharide biosynthesis putative acetyltransferase n=1 Tax=Reyranella sp. TaxID=1929291 RepID=UPI003F6EE46B